MKLEELFHNKIGENVRNFFYDMLCKRGYIVNNSNGDNLLKLYLVDFILYFIYFGITLMNILILSPGVPTLLTLTMNFIVILRSGLGRFIKRDTEKNNYFKQHENELILKEDVFIRTRENQIWWHFMCAIVYIVGFVWFAITLNVDKININAMKGQKICIKGILCISSVVAINDNFWSMLEGIYLAVPAIYRKS